MDWLNSLKDTFNQLNKQPPPDASEKRKTYRVPCNLPVVVQVSSKEALQGRLTNLSTTGLKLKFIKTLKPAVNYTMRIRGKVVPGLTQGVRELTVQARCVWCRKAADGYDVGCSFTGFVGANLNQVLEFFREELGIDIAESEQKRTTTRIARRFHVTYMAADGKVASGFVRNLSMSGLQLISKSQVQLGSQLHVTVDFGAKVERMHATVEVVRCRKIPREEWYEIGARFTEMSEKETSRLTALVAAYMKEECAEG